MLKVRANACWLKKSTFRQGRCSEVIPKKDGGKCKRIGQFQQEKREKGGEGTL